LNWNIKDLHESHIKTDGMDISWIHEDLKNSVFGKRIVYYEVIDSTNVQGKELASAGATHGTIVITEEQLAGKGRLDRKWISPRARNLMFSIVLRPDLEVDEVFFLTMLLALSVRDALKEMLDVEAFIKWPNDIYVSGKKIGGILAEFSVCEKKVEYVIIGLGLNVNWHPEEEATVLYPCTSLMKETGFPVERSSLLVEILSRFEEKYHRGMAKKGAWAEFQKQWNECSYVLGKHIVIKNGRERIAGKAVSIDRKGALIIRDSLGKQRRVIGGDVSVESIQTR